MLEIRQTEVYSQWFNNLRDQQARARIDVRIRRLSLGNPGDVRALGDGVSYQVALIEVRTASGR